MSEFTISRHINAPLETVWEVLHDFGDIDRWNPGVTFSELTSEGPVTEGATRRCDFAPFGGVNERIERHIPNERMTVHLYETFKLPISSAVADFKVAEANGGTELTLHYSYERNLLGKLSGPFTDRLLRKGLGGLTKSLQQETERLARGVS